MEILLSISMIPLLIKSINYVLIGSFAPLFTFVLFGGFLLLAYANNTRYRSLIVKTWSVAIILWGIARIGVMILFLTTSVQEAHIEGQFGIWFILLSSAYIITGFYFFKSVRKQLV